MTESPARLKQIYRVTARRKLDTEVYYEPMRLPAAIIQRLRDAGWKVRQVAVDADAEIDRLLGRSNAAGGSAAKLRGASSMSHGYWLAAGFAKMRAAAADSAANGKGELTSEEGGE
jgi:hypothetical protein